MNAVWGGLGHLHPALVHFPVALVLVAAAAEVMYVWRKKQRFGDAARFMIAAAAWLSVPAAVAGFAAAADVNPSMLRVFTIHRISGVALPVLAFLAYAMNEGARHSGQVWEQMTYRVCLLLAVVCVLLAAYCGGLLAHGQAAGHAAAAVVFDLTPRRPIWY